MLVLVCVFVVCVVFVCRCVLCLFVGLFLFTSPPSPQLVTDANIDCSSDGLSIQAMDSSHVSLCAVALRADGFDHYRCDRNMTMGMNLTNMVRV